MTISAQQGSPTKATTSHEKNRGATNTSVGLIATALSLVAILGVFIWLVSQARTAPALESKAVGELIASGEHEMALAKVEAFLQTGAGDPSVRLWAAELALDRLDPNPERALGHLDR